jgi:GNAT superfamily N-acetyltransferase
MEILTLDSSCLEEYSRIPMTLEVHTVFEPILPENGLGGIQLMERPVAAHLKDYDDYGTPESWQHEFDIANWGFFLAHDADSLLGGAAVAWNTAGVNMLEGRADLAVLWDIRVQPAARRKGVGQALFQHAAQWARERGCSMLKIETQNINVPACRFYAAQGCELGDIRRFAYADDPQIAHEVQLNWYLRL